MFSLAKYPKHIIELFKKFSGETCMINRTQNNAVNTAVLTPLLTQLATIHFLDWDEQRKM